MVAYLYFAMAVITWDLHWFMSIPDWGYQKRIVLVLILTPTLATDIYVLYEAIKTKNKARAK